MLSDISPSSSCLYLQTIAAWDYCIIGSGSAPTNNNSANSLKNTGLDACNNGSCNACEGDCDSDAGCAGDLVCFLRDDFESVPGCSGNGVAGEQYTL